MRKEVSNVRSFLIFVIVLFIFQVTQSIFIRYSLFYVSLLLYSLGLPFSSTLKSILSVPFRVILPLNWFLTFLQSGKKKEPLWFGPTPCPFRDSISLGTPKFLVISPDTLTSTSWSVLTLLQCFYSTPPSSTD